MSTPSLAFSAALMLISVSTPNPFCARASRMHATASSNRVVKFIDNATLIADMSSRGARGIRR